jgi:hypothetical protein
MRKFAFAALGISALIPMVLAVSAAPATATPPIGTCTQSYAPYTIDELAFDPAAQDIFPVIDTNGDGIICFKPYPNGPHAGHFGNLVDDKAAPHQ